MGKATNKRKRDKAANAVVAKFVRPTEQREAHNDFRSAGVAVKVIPPIETLYTTGKLNARQFNALARYADVANAAERSEIKSNIDFSIYGSGEGMPHFGVRMNLELGRYDRELGKYRLQPIVHAVCVREISVSQWAMELEGSVMRERKGREVKPGIWQMIRWFEPKRKAHEIAMLELVYAANVLAGEMGL